VRFQEAFLGQVFRVFVVADHSKKEGVDAGEVQAHEAVEGLEVASASPFEPARLAGGARGRAGAGAGRASPHYPRVQGPRVQALRALCAVLSVVIAPLDGAGGALLTLFSS